jgi:hypothetical protein
MKSRDGRDGRDVKYFIETFSSTFFGESLQKTVPVVPSDPSFPYILSNFLRTCIIFVLPDNKGFNRSPISRTRAGTDFILNTFGSSFSLTSSQWRGVDTGAFAAGRTE